MFIILCQSEPPEYKLRELDALGKFSSSFTRETIFVTYISVQAFPSEKEHTLKGKNLLPKGANSFLLE